MLERSGAGSGSRCRRPCASTSAGRRTSGRAAGTDTIRAACSGLAFGLAACSALGQKPEAATTRPVSTNRAPPRRRPVSASRNLSSIYSAACASSRRRSSRPPASISRPARAMPDDVGAGERQRARVGALTAGRRAAPPPPPRLAVIGGVVGVGVVGVAVGVAARIVGVDEAVAVVVTAVGALHAAVVARAAGTAGGIALVVVVGVVGVGVVGVAVAVTTGVACVDDAVAVVVDAVGALRRVRRPRAGATLKASDAAVVALVSDVRRPAARRRRAPRARRGTGDVVGVADDRQHARDAGHRVGRAVRAARGRERHLGAAEADDLTRCS